MESAGHLMEGWRLIGADEDIDVGAGVVAMRQRCEIPDLLIGDADFRL